MAISKMFGYDIESPVTWDEISRDPLASNYVMGKLWPDAASSKDPGKALASALQSSGVVDFIKNPTSDAAKKFFKQEIPGRLEALASTIARLTDPSSVNFFKSAMLSEAAAAKKYGFEPQDVNSYINQAQEKFNKAQEELKKPGITAFGGIKADVPISQYDLNQRPDLKALVDNAANDLFSAKNKDELFTKAINNSGIVDAIKNNTKYDVKDIESKLNKEIGFNFMGMHADIPFTYTQLTKDPVLSEYLFNNVNIGGLKSNEQLTNDLVKSGIVDAAKDPKSGAYDKIKASVAQNQADGLRRAFTAYYAGEAIRQGKESGAIPQRYWGDLSFNTGDPESLKAQIARAQSFGVSPDTVNSLLQSTQGEGLEKAKGWVNDVAIFYDPHATHEGGASWVKALGPALSLASFAVPALAPLAAFTNAGQALQSGNILGGLAAATGIPGVSDAIGAGAATALQKAGQVSNVAKSIETGNLLGALTSGANLTGTGGVQLGDTGVSVADALKTANIAKALESGNVAPLIGALASSGAVSGPSKADIEPGTFDKIQGAIDPSTYGLVDLSQTEEPYTPTTDFGFTADYGLASPKLAPTLEEMGGAQGVQAPSLPGVFTPEGTVDYGLAGPSLYGGEPGLTMPKTPNLESMGGGQGLTMPVQGGTLTEAGVIPTEYTPALGDPNSFINQPPPGADVSDAVQKAINASGGAGKTTTAAPKTTAAAAPTSTQGAGQTTSGFDIGIPWLNTKAQMIGSTTPRTDTGAKMAQLQQIYGQMSPELTSLFADRGIMPAQEGLMMATGGSTTCSLWGEMSKYLPKFTPVTGTMLQGATTRKPASGLAQLKQMYGSIGQQAGMAKGGLPSKYQEAAPDGHNPEFVTGLTGYYAGGRGTGQSDDIPAMLHDGDYVIDAEAVSALGDGSSKAGKDALTHFLGQVPHRDGAEGKPVPAKIADGEFVLPASFVTALGQGDNKRGAKMLDEMREKLRVHKRSAPTSKIPPKALSPLDYLRKAK